MKRKDRYLSSICMRGSWMALIAVVLMLPCGILSASTIRLADPTIFYEDGVYYLTGTGLVNTGFGFYTSTDLIHWTLGNGGASEGRLLAPEDAFGRYNFWAPQLIRKGDVYYLAYAAESRIAIATSNSPCGPFCVDSHEPMDPVYQIDPFLFQDDDGKVYLYHVRMDGGNHICVAEMNEDMKTIKDSTLTTCIRVEENTWENVSGAYVAEGPAVIKDRGMYYLLYTCNDYRSIDYAVGYAYSWSPTGPWTRCDKPILSRHDIGLNGTGHGDLFRDGDGQLWYVYHVHASDTEVHPRRTALVPLFLSNDPGHKFIIDYSRTYLLEDPIP